MTARALVHGSGAAPQFGSKPFLATHRAASVCAREVSLLSQKLATEALAFHTGGHAEKPVVRQSPGRCIVQLGPVAITAAWICGGQASIDEGELLVIVWRGIVAPPVEHDTERGPLQRPRSSATVLWERAFRPVASSEATWIWQSDETEVGGYASVDLANYCMDRVRLAHAENRVAPDADVAPPSPHVIAPPGRSRLSGGKAGGA